MYTQKEINDVLKIYDRLNWGWARNPDLVTQERRI